MAFAKRLTPLPIKQPSGTKPDEPAFKFTPKQEEAQAILSGPCTHILLIGGSRSGKTSLFVRNIILRALKAPGSRHVILRFRFNHCKASIVLDTFPKICKLAFPGVTYRMDKVDWYAEFTNGSQIWFGGIDDKERVEKILGNEFATIYLNEASQIPQSSRDMVVTRLAQQTVQKIEGKPDRPLKTRMYVDCNPGPKTHWTYKMFIQGMDPETRKPLPNAGDYAWFKINPEDNVANLSEGYLQTLHGLSARLRKRFLDGEYQDENANLLFSDVDIEKWRVIDATLPDMVRIVVGVDPSGAGDNDSADNDAIGIVIAGLGTDGNSYVLEDATVKAGPATWGRVACMAYERHEADIIVGESNYGGAMVEHVIMTARPRTPFKLVTATRGKHIRAEPFSALYEQGKVRHVGQFAELEDELCNFSTSGYIGEASPNRADALIWCLAELFGGIVRDRVLPKRSSTVTAGNTTFMAN